MDHDRKQAKTVCIIGGGFAGLAAAVFLDALGLKITLIERKSILGGRAYAFQDRKTGHWVDNGQHLLVGAYKETLTLIENLGVKHNLEVQPQLLVPLISDEGRQSNFSLPHRSKPFNFISGLWHFKNIPFADKWRFHRILKAVKRFELNPSKPEWDQTIAQWLSKQGQSELSQKNFWDILVLATLNDLPEIASTRFLMEVLSRSVFASPFEASLIFPKYNLNEILANPARRYLEYRGHEVRTLTAAKGFHILDEKVHSIELANGERIRADYFISAVPFQALPSLIPPGYLTLPYFKNLQHLRTSPIISFNLWFDQECMPETFVGSAATKVHWFFNKNKLYRRPYPPYHYMGVLSGAHALIEESKEELLKLVLEDFAKLYPQARAAKLVHALVNKEREATLTPAVHIDQFRPPQKSPFINLYCVGDWTQTRLPATIESAVVSARLAVEDLLKTHSSLAEVRQTA